MRCRQIVMKRKSRYALSCPAAPCARPRRYSPRPRARRTGPHAPAFRVGRAPRAAVCRCHPAQAVALSWCPLVASRPPFTTPSCCTDRSSPVLVCACAATHETISAASSFQSSLPLLPRGYSRPRSRFSAIHAQYSHFPCRRGCKTERFVEIGREGRCVFQDTYRSGPCKDFR